MLFKCTIQQIQKYERGANRVSASRLVEMANAMGVPLMAFFEGIETPDSGGSAPALPEALQDLLRSHDGVKFAEALSHIKDRGVRAAALSLIREMGRVSEA